MACGLVLVVSPPGHLHRFDVLDLGDLGAQATRGAKLSNGDDVSDENVSGKSEVIGTHASLDEYSTVIMEVLESFLHGTET